MDHKRHFHEITEFLKPYQRIWQNEIMLLYPDPLRDFPADWIQELSGFKEKDDVIMLERKEVFSFIRNPELVAFYSRIAELSVVPKIPMLPEFPARKNSFLHMIPKKQHEIRTLAPFVDAFYREHQIENLFDIGGGVGHLAQSLASHYDLKATSLDIDPVLQSTGLKRSKTLGGSGVTYLNVKVDEDEENFRQLLRPGSMTLGLHTCGALANHQIKASAARKIKGLISFGCCYEKLQREPLSQNISQAAKADPLHLSYYALTLATRAHRKMDEKDYNLKLKVKFFRYAIHALLHDEYETTEIVTLGNSNPNLYDGSFSSYVVKQFERINLPLKHTLKELDDYYADPQRQELIWKMLTAGLIRNAFGRVLELYLLLDRVLFLEEQGYRTQLLEFFDEPTSPRNLGIVGYRPS